MISSIHGRRLKITCHCEVSHQIRNGAEPTAISVFGNGRIASITRTTSGGTTSNHAGARHHVQRGQRAVAGRIASATITTRFRKGVNPAATINNRWPTDIFNAGPAVMPAAPVDLFKCVSVEDGVIGRLKFARSPDHFAGETVLDR